MTPASSRSRVPVALARPAFAAALAFLALLLFCWPFVIAPPPTLATASEMVFCAWAAVVGALWLVTRVPDGERPGRKDD